MNIMYDDRQFLLVPYMTETPLIDRLIFANRRRKDPYTLSSFIDIRTLEAHFAIPVEPEPDHKHTNAWAFYLPNSDTCPLTYRELALWFLLWSTQPKYDKPYFQSSFCGLEKLAGLGKGQASELADRLQAEGLIKLKRTEGWPWFYLNPYERYASWFVPIAGREVPPEFLEAYEKATQENAPSIVSQPVTCQVKAEEPKEWSPIIPTLDQIANGFELTSGSDYARATLIMLNEAIPIATRKTGTWNAERWWKLAEAKGIKPIYSPENAIVIQACNAKLGNRLNN